MISVSINWESAAKSSNTTTAYINNTRIIQEANFNIIESEGYWVRITEGEAYGISTKSSGEDSSS